MPPTTKQVPPDLHAVLRDVFGFHAFRPNQREIVEAMLAHQDAFVVMPTGGGKSLCYQLPAHVLPGTCLVISPLISLMKDQVDAARAIGLRAALLNSSLLPDERSAVSRRLARGELDLLYVSPERFAMESFVALLQQVRLSFVAIDEAHCISEWGHDFRPDYLSLSRIVELFPGVPVAAFTATATLRVQQDIVEKLGLREPHVVRASFNRPNLFYQVLPKDNPARQILRFVRARPGQAGIVYRTTRAAVESTAEKLAAEGIRARPYHAGLGDGERSRNQEAFNRDEIDVIVATIAFGMGIDKSNVRFVLHGDLPKNVESYYQETGRAGRDGEPAHCLLLFGYGDIPKIRHFIDQVSDETERRHALRCLNAMVSYAMAHACRRKRLLNYFGERFEEPNCGGCDVCAGEVEREDATRDAQIVLSAVARLGQRFGIGHVVDVVCGADTERLRQLGHDRLKTYGAGRDRDKRHWRGIVDNLLAQELLRQEGDPYPVLRLGPKARGVLFEGEPVFTLRHRAPKRKRKAPAGAIEYNEALFEDLRALRLRLAQEAGVPPYVVFSDRTLHEMANRFPSNEPEMAAIGGVGAHKLKTYGAAFAEAIRDFLAAHPEVEPPLSPATEQPGLDLEAPAPKRPRRRKPGAKSNRRARGESLEATWQALQEGRSLEDIALRRGLALSTIVKHLEALIAAGRPVEIDRLVDPDRRERIEALLRKAEGPRLGPVIEASGGEVTYTEARLVRAWLAARRDGGADPVPLPPR